MEIKKQIFNFNRIEHLISFKQNYNKKLINENGIKN